MYLHLGADISVNKKSIVGIFDLDNTSTSKITREYFKKVTNEGKVINVSEFDLPRSFVVTCEKGIEKVYISPISSQTQQIGETQNLLESNKRLNFKSSTQKDPLESPLYFIIFITIPERKTYF